MLKQNQEDISDSLEGLLIFPTRLGLQQIDASLRAYFAMETKLIDHREMPGTHQSIKNSRNSVMDLCARGLRRDSVHTTASTCSINIDKGIDKNIAATLACRFEEHVKLVDSVLEVK